jgi:Putative adhesin
MNPRSPSGDPGPAASEPGARRQPWRSPAVVVGAVALLAVAVAVAVSAASAHGSHGPGDTTSVSVSAGSVRTVELQAVPGQLTIVGSATSRVTLTGQVDWTHHAPAAATRLVNAHLLRLHYRCASASPCTAHWRLVVPRHTAVVLSQASGHVIVSGLAGPLRITAASVDVSATRLSSPSLQAVITSGHLAATFATPPKQVSVTLTSAQATLSMPGTVSYAVSDQVTSGYVHVGIPVSASAAHSVTARVISGELDLQAS